MIPETHASKTKPAIWGSIGNHRSVNFELGGLAVLRYGARGSRTVIAVYASAILDFMRYKQSGAARSTSSRSDPAPELTSPHAVQWLTDCSEDLAQEALMRCETDEAKDQHIGMFYAILSPGDAWYIPSGFIVAEQNQTEDNIGLKASLVIRTDTVGSSCLRWLKQEAMDADKIIGTARP